MHKLARIIYTMLKNQTEYRDPEEGYFEERACPEPFALGPQALVLYRLSHRAHVVVITGASFRAHGPRCSEKEMLIESTDSP